MKRILELLTFIFIISGFGGLLSGYISSFIDTEYLQTVEFPLSNVKSVTSGQAQEIYAYSAFYSRIQLYDNKGKFVKNWIYKPENTARLWVDNKNKLHLDKNHILDFNKGIVKAPAQNTPDYISADLYRVKNNLIFPKIVKINERDRTVVTTKFFAFWGLFIGPYPALFVGILGLIFSRISEKLQK